MAKQTVKLYGKRRGYVKNKGLKKGTFASNMYKKGVRRGKYVAAKAAYRTTRRRRENK